MSNKEVIEEVCDKGYRLPRPTVIEVPDNLWILVQKMWSRNPDDRPTFNAIVEEIDTIRKREGFVDEKDDDVVTKVPKSTGKAADYDYGAQALGGVKPDPGANEDTGNYNSMEFKDNYNDNYQL